MPEFSANLRKAAVLIHSLDDATAAKLLAQLPSSDAAAVRAAVDALDELDPEEQADVAAELRRAAPVAGAGAVAGVELAFSAASYVPDSSTPVSHASKADLQNASLHGELLTGPRFEFLEQAPITSLVPYLAREHAQTIAVVLLYLSPSRAAAVLAALPPRQQAETLERLSTIGETDPDCLKIVEQELAGWVAEQSAHRRTSRAGAAAQAILAAASSATREVILTNLKAHKGQLADQLSDSRRARKPSSNEVSRSYKFASETAASPRLSTQLDTLRATRAALAKQPAAEIAAPRPARPQQIAPPPAPRFNFDDLAKLDAQALASVLGEVAPNMLVLALTGSSDVIIEKIAGQMPRRAAKNFRKQLRTLGPTRLSDVEAAQQLVAGIAAKNFNLQPLATTSAKR